MFHFNLWESATELAMGAGYGIGYGSWLLELAMGVGYGYTNISKLFYGCLIMLLIICEKQVITDRAK